MNMIPLVKTGIYWTFLVSTYIKFKTSPDLCYLLDYNEILRHLANNATDKATLALFPTFSFRLKKIMIPIPR